MTPISDLPALSGREALTTAQDGSLMQRAITVQWHPNTHGPYQEHSANLDVVKDLAVLRELPGVNVWKDHTITASREKLDGPHMTEEQITCLARVLFAQLIDRNIHNAHPHQYWVQMREFAKELKGSQVVQFGNELDKLFAEYADEVECLSGCCPEREGLQMLLHMLEDDSASPQLNYHELRVRTREELERFYKKKTKFDEGQWHNKVQQLMDRHLKTWMDGTDADVKRFTAALGSEISQLINGKGPRICDKTHDAIRDFIELHKDTLQNLQWKLNENFHDSAYEYIRIGVLPHIKGTVISRAISDNFVKAKLRRAFSHKDEIENLVQTYYRTKEKLPLLHWQKDETDRIVWQKALLDKVAIKKAIAARENDFIERVFTEWQGSDHYFMELMQLRLAFTALNVQKAMMVREQGKHSRFSSAGRSERARFQVYIDRLDGRLDEARQKVVAFLEDITPPAERGQMTDEDLGSIPAKRRFEVEKIGYFISMLQEIQVLEKGKLFEEFHLFEKGSKVRHGLPKKYRKVYEDKQIDAAIEKALCSLKHRAVRYRKVACVDEESNRRVIQDRHTCIEACQHKEEKKLESRLMRDEVYSPTAFDWWNFNVES